MMTPVEAVPRDRIFISYRRNDARGASGRVYDWLRIAFGRDCVFRDVHSIGVGKWRDKINAALARSAACIAVIGPRWANETNLPRLHDPEDMVRHELVTALGDTSITMIPALVEDAALADVPRQQLPNVLRPLFSDWNVCPISEGGWEDDIRRLIGEIAEATALPLLSDYEGLLRTVAGAEQAVAAKQQKRKAPADQLAASQRTIDELRSRLAEASTGERSRLAEAFAELARGNTLRAEEAFEREYEASIQTAAEAARNVGNLALLRDVTKAAAYFRKALAIEPDHGETARRLGYALITLGDLKAAAEAFDQAQRSAVEQGNEWAKSAALDGVGDVLLAQGDRSGALRSYRAGLEIREELAKRDPANTEWQVDFAVSCWKLGSTDSLLSVSERRAFLSRGREILIHLKSAGRLAANQDWIGYFDDALHNLPTE